MATPEDASVDRSGDRPVVVDYRPEWTARFATLAAQLEGALGPTALRIEHIGSTAIPGMAAKDLLDVQVSVADLDRAADAFDPPLRGLGYAASRHGFDHVPVGRADDPQRWRKRLWTRRAHPGGDVNLHVRVAGSPNERLALLFRDWVRAHPEALAPYSAFKRTLAGLATTADGYADAKDPVVDLVVAVAERWAAQVGWEPVSGAGG